MPESQRWQSAASTAAAGATLGTALLPGIGTAIGGVLGGAAGYFLSPEEEKLPELDAAQYARDYMSRYGGFGQKAGSVSAMSQSLGNQTAAQLISAGVDPASARNIASRRAQQAQAQGMDSLIQSETAQEAQLAGNLLPYQIQREEDIISQKNMQANWGDTAADILNAGVAIAGMNSLNKTNNQGTIGDTPANLNPVSGISSGGGLTGVSASQITPTQRLSAGLRQFTPEQYTAFRMGGIPLPW